MLAVARSRKVGHETTQGSEEKVVKEVRRLSCDGLGTDGRALMLQLDHG